MWKDKIPSGKAARWLLHIGLLFAAMLAAYVAAGPANFFTATGVVFALGLGYYLWPIIRHRKRWTKRKSGFFGTTVLIFIGQTSGALAAVALIGASVLMWLSNAYSWEQILAIQGADPERSGFPQAPTVFANLSWVAVCLLLAAAVIFLMTIAIRPWVERRAVDENPTPLRGRDVPGVLSFWFTGFLSLVTFYLLVALTGTAFLLFLGLDAIRWDRALTTADLFLHLPALPLGFLVLAWLVVVLRESDIQSAWDTRQPASAESAAAPPKILGISLPGMATASAAGFAAIVFALIYFAHIVVILLDSLVPAVATGDMTQRALNNWAVEQREAGRPEADIAAAIHEMGRWSPDAPTEGLARLLPELIDSIARWSCRVAVTAGTIDATERRAAPWSDTLVLPRAVRHEDSRAFLDYMFEPADEKEPEDSASVATADPEGEEHSEDNEEYAPPPVRYCVKVTCPVQAPWQAPDEVVLFISHPSASPHRMFLVNRHVLGRDAAPGGYCTADGGLAESYQG